MIQWEIIKKKYNAWKDGTANRYGSPYPESFKLDAQRIISDFSKAIEAAYFRGFDDGFELFKDAANAIVESQPKQQVTETQRDPKDPWEVFKK